MHPDHVVHFLGYKRIPFFRKQMQENGIKVPFTNRTFRNIFSGKNKPSKNYKEWIENLTFPDTEIKLWDLYQEKQWQSPWETILTSFNASSQSFDPSHILFPVTQAKLLELDRTGRDLFFEIHDLQNQDVLKEKLQKNYFFKKFSGESWNIDSVAVNSSVYLIACLEAEFIFSDDREFPLKHSRIAKYLLPIKNNGKTRLPLRGFFEFWREKIKDEENFHSVRQMIYFMNPEDPGHPSGSKINVNGMEAEQRRFDAWILGEQTPKDLEDIKKIIRGVFERLKGEEISEYWLDVVTNIFLIALFLQNLFLHFRKQTHPDNGTAFLRSEEDLIALFENYKTYYAEWRAFFESRDADPRPENN